MKILWLSHFVPFPPKGGCFQRSYNLLMRMCRDNDVHVLAMRHKHAAHPESEVRPAREELLRHCRSVDIVNITREQEPLWFGLLAAVSVATARPFNVTVYQSRAFRQLLHSTVRRTSFDVVHLDTIGLAQYLDDLPGLPTVLTHHGAESHMLNRRIPNEPSILRRAFFKYEQLALRAYERRMCRRVDANVTVCEDDAAILAAISPGSMFTTVENGVDLAYYSCEPAPAPDRRLVFAGRLDQYSNRHGMAVFMSEVWPLLKARDPDISIDIIGSHPSRSLQAIAGADVRIHGFVSDVRPFFQAATAAICPIWDGGGTRLKVLDTLALRTPLVSTAIGCEGLDVVDGRHALLVNKPIEFVAAVGRLMSDAALRHRLSVNGRTLVEQRYSWDTIAPRLHGICRRLARGPAVAGH